MQHLLLTRLSSLSQAERAGELNAAADWYMRARERPISELASQEALTAAHRCGSEAIEAKALALTAQVTVEKGDKSATTQNIEDALQLARRLGDESVLSFIFYRAAYCYSELGDFSRCAPL